MRPLIWSWVAYATLPLAGLLTGPIIARALGPEGRGQLAGILQPMTLAGAIAALGVPSAVTYFVGRGHDSRRVRNQAIQISTMMTVVVAAVLLFYSRKVAESIGVSRGVILLLWTAFVPSAYVSIRRSLLQGQRLYSRIDLERTLISVFRAGSILLLFIVGSRSVAAYSAAFMIAGLAASGALLVPSTKGGMQSNEKVGVLKRSDLLRFALFSSFGTIATAMNSRLDQAIMPAAVPAVELGLYSVAVTVSEVALIITAVIARNILAETSARAPKRRIMRFVLLGAVGQLLLCGTMLLAIPYLLPLVFGSGFAPAVLLVKILLLATLIGYGADCFSAFLAGSGNPEYASVGPAMGAISTAVLFWIFWHHMSAAAASWISVAAQGATFSTGAVLIAVLASRARNKRINSATSPAVELKHASL
jgi:O-antigen/teichoic acid export membrane protein